MRKPPFALWLFIALTIGPSADANSTCTSVLTADQLHELTLTIFPEHAFSPGLIDALEGDNAQGAVKRLSKTNVERLRGVIAHPFVGGPVGDVRENQAALLRRWLNANPNSELPAWDAAAAGSDNPSDWVPRAWLGRSADEFVHLIKESGNAGPLTGAAIGARTTRGRMLGITVHVAADSSGRDVYLWSYLYRGIIGGRLLTTILAICQADLVTMSDDEAAIRALEQELAKAWPTRDRLTIERILAREWSGTLPDAATVSRVAQLAAAFDRSERIVENVATNDDGVTVRLFDDAAVVRGRTVTTFAIGGVRQTTTVQFTDFFVKRDGIWKLVASHQTNAGP